MSAVRGVRSVAAVLSRAGAIAAVTALLATSCGGGTTNKPGDDPVVRTPTSSAKPSSGDGY